MMRYFVWAILFFATPYIYGQEIRFKKTSHDFGKIDEQMQYAKCKFIYYNIGKKPLIINNVQTSCGCTTPDWTRDTLSPGDSGYVEAKYETINRPGDFRKTITVYSNALNSPFVHLDIMGDVYRAPASSSDIEIPVYGKVYFDPETISFDALYDNKIDSQTVRLINASVYSTAFQPLTGLPAFCKVIGYPTSLEPNESVKITVIIDGTKINTYGFGAFQVAFLTDNPMNPRLGLYVAYKRKQYFPKMSAKKLKQAPKIVFDKELHDFGSAENGGFLTTKFKVTNNGKEDLILREVYPECTCLRVNFNKKVLKPGESMDIEVIYDTVAKKGMSNQSIWIVSNDPSRPEMFIYVRAKLPDKVYHCPTCH